MGSESNERKAHFKWTPENLKQVKALLDEGCSIPEIAKTMNVSMNAMKYLFEKHGGKENFSIEPLGQTPRPMQVNLSAVSMDIVNALNVILKKITNIEQTLNRLENDTKN